MKSPESLIYIKYMGIFLVVLYFIIKFAPSLRISLIELLKQIAGYSYTWGRGSSVTRSFEALEILTEKMRATIFEVAWSIYRLLSHIS